MGMITTKLRMVVIPGKEAGRCKKERVRDFPGGAVVKNLPANAGDTGSSPGLGRFTRCGATKPVRHNY